jgi:hypothetical protein
MDKMQRLVVENWLKHCDVVERYEFNQKYQEYLIFLTSEVNIRLSRKLDDDFEWFLIDNYNHFLKIKQLWNSDSIYDLSWYDDEAIGF